MKRRKGRFDRYAQSLANSLTAEQAIALYQIVDPLTPEEQAKYAAMTDDELLKELSDPIGP